MKTQGSVIINLPAEDVFAVVSDLENMPRYEAFVIAAKKTSEGQIGIGTTFEVIGRMLLWNIKTVLKIIAWQPGRAFTIKTLSSPIAAQTDYVFEPLAEGTRLTIIDDTKLGGPFKFLEPPLAKYTQKRFKTDLITMKTYLESASSQHAA